MNFILTGVVFLLSTNLQTFIQISTSVTKDTIASCVVIRENNAFCSNVGWQVVGEKKEQGEPTIDPCGIPCFFCITLMYVVLKAQQKLIKIKSFQLCALYQNFSNKALYETYVCTYVYKMFEHIVIKTFHNCGNGVTKGKLKVMQ